ncbi:glycosyltransferase family 2 protein [Candidatus Parcubacteria bacterium]|jgi:glycosyltransferase involved in cell wall biosynthesis|nr:MAG: glycosyltransferase family 2 protein [Candidatus Parcubacteria bacterium]
MWNLKSVRDQHKIIAVLPAFEAEKTLEKTVNDIPNDWVDEIVLVDDASSDNTVAKAKTLGLHPTVHEKNLGYGGNQKTCYAEALKRGADVIIMIHPDHQYDPVLVPEMVLPILRGESDVVFGSRMLWRGGAKKGGMPWWKRIANVFLTAIENLVLGLRLSEYHSGFRAYSRKVLETVPFKKNSNDFVFDTEMIIQLKICGFRIREVPIPTRYFKDAHTVGFFAGVKYGLGILRALAEYLLARLRLRPSQKFSKNSVLSAT